MGFTTGAKVTADIWEEIINGLLTSGVWHNVDTTWTTTDRTSNNARKVLAYGAAGGSGKGNTFTVGTINAGTNIIPVVSETNFMNGDKIVIGSGHTAEVRIVSTVSVGQLTVDANINTNHAINETVKELDFEIYMAMEMINSQIDTYSGYKSKGVRFVFSASWDAVAHTYPSSNQSTLIPFESHTTTISADLATMMITYYLWIEVNGNGFVVMGKPEPNSTDNAQQSFIIVVERNPTKEYSDGYTNFFLYSACNMWPCLYDGNQVTLSRNRSLLRPFAFQWPDTVVYITAQSANGSGISFIPSPGYYAHVSNGDGKVYYVKLLVHNHAGQTMPIFQSNLFFIWSEGGGLIDGDIVSLENQTTKFLCKGLDSPDSTNRITYAMKYVV